MKTAIVILSDPKSGSDEALGRVFNGLATAFDVRSQGGQASILFHGPATRWPGVLADAEHPAHGLYQEVKELVAGVSCACADAFGGGAEAQAAGLELIKDNPLPGTSGLPSLARLKADGFDVLTF